MPKIKGCYNTRVPQVDSNESDIEKINNVEAEELITLLSRKEPYRTHIERITERELQNKYQTLLKTHGEGENSSIATVIKLDTIYPNWLMITEIVWDDGTTTLGINL